MKSQKYQQQLVKALENFCEAADKLASIATNNELLDQDIKYAQNLTKERVAELKKQLEHKTVKVEISLPSASAASGNEQKKSGLTQDNKSASTTSTDNETTKPNGF